MAKFLTRQKEVEAILFTGRNYAEIAAFIPFLTRESPIAVGIQIRPSINETVWFDLPVGYYVVKTSYGVDMVPLNIFEDNHESI